MHKRPMTRSNANTATAERRGAPREKVDPIEVRGLMSLDHMTLLSRSGKIVDASKTGFLMLIERSDLLPKVFKESLTLQELDGDRIILTIDALNLELGGTIVRSKRITKETFEIVVDFSDDAPDYWRECLFEMLPRSSDFE